MFDEPNQYNLQIVCAWNLNQTKPKLNHHLPYMCKLERKKAHSCFSQNLTTDSVPYKRINCYMFRIHHVANVPYNRRRTYGITLNLTALLFMICDWLHCKYFTCHIFIGCYTNQSVPEHPNQFRVTYIFCKLFFTISFCNFLHF